MSLPFPNRKAAGQTLAGLLADLRNQDDLLVLGLPRGGVPVAYEVALELDAPLDVYIVRKLGVPGHEELAMGAIASGDVRVLNENVILDFGIGKASIEAVAAMERRELHRRERLYRGTRPAPPIRERTVILVDDGLATGTTMLAAVQAIRQLAPREVIVAVPVAPREAPRAFESLVDRIACVETPARFYALGQWYEDFRPTPDEEVQVLLAKAASRPGPGAGPAVAPTPGPGLRPASLPAAIGKAAHPLTGQPNAYDTLLDEIGDARFVLIGEASHGSTEFYRERATITCRLIEERGFQAVAAEADWPDAFRVNRFVRGTGEDTTADEALANFRRFPQWMWRNTVMREFIDWLRARNEQQAQENQAGFYGLDLYSLHASIQAVLEYLDTVDPEAASRARARYGCFDHYADDVHAYGHAVGLGTAEDCEDAVVNQLVELRRQAADLAARDGQAAADAFFSAEQNARLARNAEAYYRSMFRGRISSWNLRDTHMAETLDALVEHLTARNGQPAKLVVWAHNSHLGDARATQMGQAGELNLGQLTRERHDRETFLIGQTTDHGTVTAAHEWDDLPARRTVRPGMDGSYEALFHEVPHERFILSLRDADSRLAEPRLERAIGVIYRPETERLSHYFDARLADQFDAVIHHDETTALEPLDRLPAWDHSDVPETYPFAGEPLPGRRTA